MSSGRQCGLGCRYRSRNSSDSRTIPKRSGIGPNHLLAAGSNSTIGPGHPGSTGERDIMPARCSTDFFEPRPTDRSGNFLRSSRMRSVNGIARLGLVQSIPANACTHVRNHLCIPSATTKTIRDSKQGSTWRRHSPLQLLIETDTRYLIQEFLPSNYVILFSKDGMPNGSSTRNASNRR